MSKYHLDASSLLDDILAETESEASRERAQIEAALREREEALKLQQEVEADRLRTEAQEASRREGERRRAAAERRTLIADAMREAVKVQAEPPEFKVREPSGLMSFAQAEHWSGAHEVVGPPRSRWGLVVAAAMLLLISAGSAAFLASSAAPGVDDTTYSKAPVAFEVAHSDARSAALSVLVEEAPVVTIIVAANTPDDDDNGHHRRTPREPEVEVEEPEVWEPPTLDEGWLGRVGAEEVNE